MRRLENPPSESSLHVVSGFGWPFSPFGKMKNDPTIVRFKSVESLVGYRNANRISQLFSTARVNTCPLILTGTRRKDMEDITCSV